MEEPPKFIKEFSKEKSPEDRRQTAQKIRAKRAEHFAEKRTPTDRRQELREGIGERGRVLVEQLEQIQNLEGEANALSEKLDSKDMPPALQEARTMRDNFYREQKEKWANSGYTKEDIIKYFSEEYLTSLSLEDYILLLKRFPCEMVAHVTRQGIRDHIGHLYHTGGEGAYIDGFMRMVEDGRLRSPLGVYLAEGEKEQAVARFLDRDGFKSKEEALEYLSVLTNTTHMGESGSYTDSMAIHFAAEEVADCYYGSERGNEIFIVYPSAYVASQYYFNGQLEKGGGGYWNDRWVWANEERGMDLNAGLVFIPEEARVDRKTGSRYKLDKDRNPIKNRGYTSAFRRLADSADFHNFANEVMEITGKLNQHWGEPNLLPENRKLLQQLKPFRQRLEKEFGITDERLQFAILDYHNLLDLDIQKRREEEGRRPDPFQSVDSAIEEALKKEGILYLEAEDTISSKEFWEAYFAKNPAKRPSRVVYYKGADPTSALWRWRKGQGLNKKARDEDMGFSERHIQRSASQATAGLDRFRTLAEKVIEDHFAKIGSRVLVKPSPS